MSLFFLNDSVLLGDWVCSFIYLRRFPIYGRFNRSVEAFQFSQRPNRLLGLIFEPAGRCVHRLQLRQQNGLFYLFKDEIGVFYIGLNIQRVSGRNAK